MLDIQKIIVPVDFHQHTDDLAKFALYVANKLGATPIFLHVVENFALAASYGDAAPEALVQMEEELFVRARGKMDALLNKSKTICSTCTGQVLAGDAADCIV